MVAQRGTTSAYTSKTFGMLTTTNHSLEVIYTQLAAVGTPVVVVAGSHLVYHYQTHASAVYVCWLFGSFCVWRDVL